ncbi:MAG TPA: hypothetical protein VFN25_01980 [Dokdonella sp.]|uniref:hypothetical protein n=1 Tax=Dokdonella sp. TaxID=2291710 RepID=UPI002D7FBED8|nr:hypothetical protein [Dokdonella sp.]HET9031653.1 hypothetical protein [Dokdonella sp.]
MKSVLLVSTLAAVLGLSACSQQDSAVEAQRDVDQARQQAAEDVAEARQDAAQTSAEAQQKLDAAREAARADVAEADAKANEKINAATDEAMSTADEANQDVAEVRADTIHAQAKADYDLAVAKADADLKIALEKCESMASGQVVVCKDQANATHEIAKANAKRALDDAQAVARDTKR